MSWSAIAAAGNALKNYQDTQRRQTIEDEQLAGQREDRTMRRDMQAMQLGQMKRADAEAQKVQQRTDAYGGLLMDSADPVAFYQSKATKAKELRDANGYFEAVNGLAQEKQKQYTSRIQGGLRQLMVSGDPSAIMQAYNESFPDGNQVAVAPGSKPGTYAVTFTDKSGKVHEAGEMDRDGIGRMTMMSADPKFAETIFKDQAKADLELKRDAAKADVQLTRDKDKAKFTSELEDQKDKNRTEREAGNIKLRGQIDLGNSMKTIGAQSSASKALAEFKSKLDGGDNTKALDARAKTAVSIVHDGLKTDMSGAMSESNQPIFLEAVKRAGELVREGVDPQTAGTRALNEAKANVKAQKFGPQTPATQTGVRDFSQVFR
jgi:hypothetical protein